MNPSEASATRIDARLRSRFTSCLTGQKALVTGANSGIGKGVAIALGQAGADVVVNYVDDDAAADAVVEEIRKSGARAYAHKADVSSEDQVAAMFARMMREFGTIDILVSNAGLQRDSAFHEMTLAQWNTVLERQPDRAVPVRARSGAGISAPRRGAFGIERGGENHLHEFGSSGNSVGRPCQLCLIQGRHQIVDGEHGAGTRAASGSASTPSRPARSGPRSTPRPGRPRRPMMR